MKEMERANNVTEEPKNLKGGDELGFVELLEEKLNPPKEGEIVKGTIVKVVQDEVYIDIGAKSEGVAPKSEFKEEELEPGKEVFVYIDALDGRDGRTIVSKHKADFLRAWDKIKEAYQSNQTIEAKVLRTVKGGLMVEVFGVNAFLPGSQLDLTRVKNIPSYVGKTIPVKVIKINKARKNIVVSRREVLLEEQEKLRQKLMEIRPGDVIEGVVKNVTDFGAFVDIGGIDGLIYISELSWTKIGHPSEVVKPGDKVKVKVLEVDPENMKISLSLKLLQPHPWEKVKEKYPVGTTVRGTVKKIIDYGIFVELEPGIEGFVHISEMKWGKPPRHPSEVVKEGARVDVVVLNVDIEKQRISLGMKQAQPDPWALIEEKYPVGSIVKGVVKEFENYGAYIELEDGIEGFLHVADISWTQKFAKPEEALRKGQKLRLKVLKIDKKKRLLDLGLKHLSPNPWDEIEAKIPPGTHLKAPIKQITDKGVVVEVDKGLDGFVAVSHLQKKGDPAKNYQVGEELNLQVMKIEPKRKRILLSEREYYRAKEKEEVARYKPEPAKINLGEILQAELQRIEELKEEEEKSQEE